MVSKKNSLFTAYLQLQCHYTVVQIKIWYKGKNKIYLNNTSTTTNDFPTIESFQLKILDFDNTLMTFCNIKHTNLITFHYLSTTPL